MIIFVMCERHFHQYKKSLGQAKHKKIHQILYDVENLICYCQTTVLNFPIQLYLHFFPICTIDRDQLDKLLVKLFEDLKQI